MARILIVEDEAILAMNSRMTLMEMGHQVVGIESTGSTAIETAMRERPDLILMDIVLKGKMSGIETTLIICDQYPECNVIYMTAHTDAMTVERARKTKHTGFLFKPFDSADLSRVVELALKHPN